MVLPVVFDFPLSVVGVTQPWLSVEAGVSVAFSSFVVSALLDSGFGSSALIGASCVAVPSIGSLAEGFTTISAATTDLTGLGEASSVSGGGIVEGTSSLLVSADTDGTEWSSAGSSGIGVGNLTVAVKSLPSSNEVSASS